MTVYVKKIKQSYLGVSFDFVNIQLNESQEDASNLLEILQNHCTISEIESPELVRLRDKLIEELSKNVS